MKIHFQVEGQMTNSSKTNIFATNSLIKRVSSAMGIIPADEENQGDWQTSEFQDTEPEAPPALWLDSLLR